jgi:hypothetical protein
VALVEELLFEGVYLDAAPLIRTTCVSPRGQYLKAGQPCYSTVNEWFKDAARVLGLDPSKYGTHSGRQGGATRAANVDVPDRLFRAHGGWRSEHAKDGYVLDRLQARLSVTANMGLQEGVSVAELEAFERESRMLSL